jgi:prepilin signal peptidase PulO-like enzyme (type II secretory pathway)
LRCCWQPSRFSRGPGDADALLLASVGAWEGWRVTLRSGWWAALAGLVLVTIAWRSGRRSFTYVPALAVGFAAAVLV